MGRFMEKRKYLKDRGVDSMAQRRFSKRAESRNAFLIRMLDFQNNTWQGEIVRLGTKETKGFRSAMELLTLLDSGITIPEQAEPEKE
jgi:hypothetical protein